MFLFIALVKTTQVSEKASDLTNTTATIIFKESAQISEASIIEEEVILEVAEVAEMTIDIEEALTQVKTLKFSYILILGGGYRSSSNQDANAWEGSNDQYSSSK